MSKRSFILIYVRVEKKLRIACALSYDFPLTAKQINLFTMITFLLSITVIVASMLNEPRI